MKFYPEDIKFIIDYKKNYKRLSDNILFIPFFKNTIDNNIINTLKKNANLREDLKDLKEDIETSLNELNSKLTQYISECNTINDSIYIELNELDNSFYEYFVKIPKLNFTNAIVLFHRNIDKKILKKLEQIYNNFDLFYTSHNYSDIIYYNKKNISFNNLVSNIVNKLNETTDEDNSIIYKHMQNSRRNCSPYSNDLKEALLIKFNSFYNVWYFPCQKQDGLL